MWVLQSSKKFSTKLPSGTILSFQTFLKKSELWLFQITEYINYVIQNQLLTPIPTEKM